MRSVCGRPLARAFKPAIVWPKVSASSRSKPSRSATTAAHHQHRGTGIRTNHNDSLSDQNWTVKVLTVHLPPRTQGIPMGCRTRLGAVLSVNSCNFGLKGARRAGSSASLTDRAYAPLIASAAVGRRKRRQRLPCSSSPSRGTQPAPRHPPQPQRNGGGRAEQHTASPFGELGNQTSGGQRRRRGAADRLTRASFSRSPFRVRQT
jgi:hypothetical protein